MTPQEIALFVYNLSLIPVIFFSILFLLIAFLNMFIEKDKRIYTFSGKYPFITIQIPVYNDDVAQECIKSCLKFDYPKHRYEIIIADDSSDREIASRLRNYAIKYKDLVRYVHRNNRHGYKPGALNNILPLSKGEIIVLFDSDWRPQKDFLKKIIKPIMDDDSVAIVQAKQAFINLNTNLVSRFSAYLLMIYHSVIMPLNNKVNSVFFCGTAGAVRRDVLEKVGRWNAQSITEDADLSVKVLSEGYKIRYLDIAVPSEVPETIEGFVKQQMRWCYGLTRAYFDNINNIFYSKKLSILQKITITYSTLANVIAPIVVIMTIFGMLGWFLGEPEIFHVQDLYTLFGKLIYTSGFLILGGIALNREGQLKEYPHLVIGAFSISLVLVAFNSFAFIRAVLNKPLLWYRTPKSGNIIAKEHDT